MKTVVWACRNVEFTHSDRMVCGLNVIDFEAVVNSHPLLFAIPQCYFSFRVQAFIVATPQQCFVRDLLFYVLNAMRGANQKSLHAQQ